MIDSLTVSAHDFGNGLLLGLCIGWLSGTAIGVLAGAVLATLRAQPRPAPDPANPMRRLSNWCDRVCDDATFGGYRP